MWIISCVSHSARFAAFIFFISAYIFLTDNQNLYRFIIII